MPSHLEIPMLPPSPSPPTSSTSQNRKGNKRKGERGGGILRNIKRGVLILVGKEERTSLRKRKEENERFPPQISCPSSCHSSGRSRVTPRLLQTPSSINSSRASFRRTKKGNVLHLLGISLEASSPTVSSSVRSSIPGSPLPPRSPVPTSCASSRPTSQRERRRSDGGLPRGRRNSHEHKRPPLISKSGAEGTPRKLQIPWLENAHGDEASMASFMKGFPSYTDDDGIDSPIRVRQRQVPPSPLRPVDDIKKMDVKVSSARLSSRSLSAHPRRRPTPLLKLPERESNDDVLATSFGSSHHSTDVAEVLTAALRSCPLSQL